MDPTGRQEARRRRCRVTPITTHPFTPPFTNMKPVKTLLLIATLMCAAVSLALGQVYQAWAVLFIGTAASITWRDVLDHQHRTGTFTFAAPTLVATLPVTHEDLSDQMAVLDMEATLFTSATPKGDAPEDTTYRAPLDKLDDPRLGGLKDGQQVTRANVKNRQSNRAQVHGCVQHVRETYGASLVARLVKNPAGIEDVIADGKEKTLKALKRNWELIALSDQDQQDITASLAGLTRGAVMWGYTDAQPNSALAVPTAYRPAAAQRVSVSGATDITEAKFRTMMLELRRARKASIDVMAFCTLDSAVQFDTFFREQVPVAGSAVPVRTFQHDPEVEEYTEMITTYRTRNGKVSVDGTEYLNGLRNSAPSLTGDTTSGSAVITGLLNVPLDDDGNSALQPFSPISGTGIPAGAYIVSVDSATQITISANATANGNDVSLKLGVETQMLFVDLSFWEQKPSLVPSHKPLPEDGGGEDGYSEMINSLFCTYPALIGSFYKA